MSASVEVRHFNEFTSLYCVNMLSDNSQVQTGSDLTKDLTTQLLTLHHNRIIIASYYVI